MSKVIFRLREIRESKYMTQAELADRSGVAIGVISKAENGGKVSLGSIKNIAKGLGVNPDKLR